MPYSVNPDHGYLEWRDSPGGGGPDIVKINVDAATAPGTNPVVATAAGEITVTGGQVSSSAIGSSVIRTNSLAANTFTIQIQQSGSAATENTDLNGVSHFNSSHFSVSNGFVSLSGGGLAIDQVTVDTFSGTGTNPVLPNPVNGNITVTAAQIAANMTANVIRTSSLSPNSYTIEIQRSSTISSSDSNRNGVSHFNSGHFTVDGNGFVSSTGGGLKWVNIGASQTLEVNTGYFCSSGGALSLALPSSSAVGDVIAVVLDGSTSWTVTQGAGQQMRIGNVQTTSGAGGSIASTASGDTIYFVCRTADTRWVVINSTGVFTVV